MKFIARTLLFLAIVAAVLLAVAYLLPREVAVARSTTINAAPEAVFPYMNDLRKFNEWQPWAKKDPNTKFEFEGPDSGKGQKLTWSSVHEGVGSGTQEIIESIENKFVRTALDFGDHGTAEAVMKFEPDGEATKVTWGFTTDMGNNPIARYMGMMMDSWVGGDYEKGLADLKKLVESQGAAGS